MREGAFGADSVQVAEALHDLAEALKAQGNYAEAERLYWRSVMIRSYLQGSAHAALWPTFKGLAEINQALGRPGEAGMLYSRASAIAEKSLPSFTRARLYEFAVGDTETAAMARGSSASLLLMPGATLSERALGVKHPEVARSYAVMSGLLAAQRGEPAPGARSAPDAAPRPASPR